MTVSKKIRLTITVDDVLRRCVLSQHLLEENKKSYRPECHPGELAARL
jgi:hypothetical protein